MSISVPTTSMSRDEALGVIVRAFLSNNGAGQDVVAEIGEIARSVMWKNGFHVPHASWAFRIVEPGWAPDPQLEVDVGVAAPHCVTDVLNAKITDQYLSLITSRLSDPTPAMPSKWDLPGDSSDRRPYKTEDIIACAKQALASHMDVSYPSGRDPCSRIVRDLYDDGCDSWTHPRAPCPDSGDIFKDYVKGIFDSAVGFCSGTWSPEPHDTCPRFLYH